MLQRPSGWVSAFGLGFSAATATPGPSLTRILGDIDKSTVPDDIWGERFPTGETQHLKQGGWVAIWGGKTWPWPSVFGKLNSMLIRCLDLSASTTDYIATQLAKQYKLRVICIADISRHGQTLHKAGATCSSLVDRFHTTQAIETIRGVTGGRLRYALDMVGRETATVLQRTLSTDPHSSQARLLGLTGMPKERHPCIRYHAVPVKLFHICEPVAEGLMRWLESLLESKELIPPNLIARREGLAGVK
ncbi:hypothetical protein BDW68DRAFT_39742 [Aspergillus falconensis]